MTAIPVPEPAPALPPAGFLRLSQVRELVPVSKSTIYAWISEGSFPKPVSLSPRTVAWIASEVHEWCARRAAQARGGA